MNEKARIAALEQLQRHKGWQILHETMEREIVTAAMQIAENPHMTQQEIDFRRGAIWAAKQMLNLPGRITNQLQTELALSPKDDKDEHG